MSTEQVKNKEIPRILIVDDIAINVEILENIIQNTGYETMCALSVQEAIGLIRENKPTLILSDLSMPEVDGLEFCRMLKSDPATRDIPFIVISVLDTSEEKEQAFLAGAVDFIPKPFDPVEVIMRVNNQLNSYWLKRDMADYNRKMHKLVESQKKQLEQVRKNILFTLTGILAKNDPDMERHLETVGENAKLLAQGLQFMPEYEKSVTDEFVDVIGETAKLHAVGDLVMPGMSRTLNGVDDAQTVEKYTKESTEILQNVCDGLNDSLFLTMAVGVAGFRYARWDGAGYPAAKEREIPLEARIVALAADFDRLVHGEGLSPEEGEERIKALSGSAYEPDIVEVFAKIRRRIRM